MFGHHLNSSYRMITSLDVIDALTALILGFVMNMFISSSMDSVLANIFTLWFSVIVDVFKSQL
jgi:membrane protein required for beta-lactamase induction